MPVNRRWITRQWIIRLIASIALACAFCPSGALAQSAVLINFDAANPPFMYGSTGKVEGFYPELIDAVFRQMKQPVILAAKPWKRAVGELDLALAGVGGIYKTEERLKKYDFSETLFVERIVAYYHRDKPIHYKTLVDLYGKRIGILLGWSYGSAFDDARKAGRFTVEEVAADSQNFDKLAQRRLDAVLAIEQVGAHLMGAARNAGIEKSQVYLAENPTHLAFNKKQLAQALLNDFNRALGEIRKNGTYAQLVERIGAADR